MTWPLSQVELNGATIIPVRPFVKAAVRAKIRAQGRIKRRLAKRKKPEPGMQPCRPPAGGEILVAQRTSASTIAGMKTNIVLPALVALMTALLSAAAADKDMRCFEMRVYYAAPGKLDALQTRFRDHTCKLFEKHGMVNIGYWLPVENPDNKIVYLLAYPSREAREQAWKDFMADPDWQTAMKASEVNGKLVAKADVVFLEATDFSPAIKASASASPRLFELRTYTASKGNLDNLLARFRDHTLALFAKHGIVSVGYWTPTEAKNGAGEKLVYLVAHKDKEAADASWRAFRADPDWVSAKKTSEDKAGGSLTAENGVKSEFMTPTDFSPIR
jgi:hypothetical protein